MITLTSLIDEKKCYETVRELRWSDGVSCPHCGSKEVKLRGLHDTHTHRQRYQCKAPSCGKQFDDLTGSIFAGRHQSLRVWICCLYLMGLNLSNAQLAQELGLNKDDVHQMATQLREGIVEAKPEVQLSGEVEFDEVYITAGHKGNAAAVAKKTVAQYGFQGAMRGALLTGYQAKLCLAFGHCEQTQRNRDTRVASPEKSPDAASARSATVTKILPSC